MKPKYAKHIVFILSLSFVSAIHLAACEKHRQAADADKEHKHSAHNIADSEKKESCACAFKAVAPTSPPTEQSETSAPIKGYPLHGVVVDVLPQKGGLLVKHDEVPGVMKAMTMLFKVDETTLQAVRKDQTVTGLLVRRTDGWWLLEVNTEK